MGMYGAHETNLLNTEYTLPNLVAGFNNRIVKLFYFCDDMVSQFIDKKR